MSPSKDFNASASSHEASKALIDVIERLEPFEKDIRQRILKAAMVFLVDAKIHSAEASTFTEHVQRQHGIVRR